jgi:hypothetical protein
MANEVTELNVATGELITRDYTPEEAAEAIARQTQAAADEVIRAQIEEDNFTHEGVMLTIAKGFHDHENRIRVLESRPTVTLQQVITALKAL